MWLPGGGHVWLLGACGVAGWGACIIVGGMHGCGGHELSWGACIGYDKIWSMSGWYASYWNAFLIFDKLSIVL